jgi:plastocyanin
VKKVSIVALLALSVALPAHASPVVVTGPGSYSAGYTTPVVTYQRGSTLTYVNADVQPHNVIAVDATRPDGSAPWCFGYPSGTCPLFWSDLIGIGETTEVLGLELTESAGIYAFYCDLHPNMEGVLVAI